MQYRSTISAGASIMGVPGLSVPGMHILPPPPFFISEFGLSEIFLETEVD